MSDSERMEAIAQRCELATPGEWRWQWIGNAMCLVTPPGALVVLSSMYVEGQDYIVVRDEYDKLVPPYTGHPDTEFIAAARQDLPWLLAEVARLKRGEFSPEELHELCHNLSETDACQFAAGCNEYQRKLFGVAANDKLAAELVQCRADLVMAFERIAKQSELLSRKAAKRVNGG